jgi:hypothetical protein
VSVAARGLPRGSPLDGLVDPDALAHYAAWHHEQIRTGDIDPAYPFLVAYADVGGLSGEEAATLSLSYLAVYHMRSGIEAWLENRGLPSHFARHTPTGVERRNHRAWRALDDHLSSLAYHCRRVGGAQAWMTGAGSWAAMRERAEMVEGNGRWASYKLAEVASKVHGAPYCAPDAGHRDSTGPRRGLRRLGVPDPGDNSSATIRYLDTVTAQLAQILGEEDLARVETSLCDWSSHLAGRHPMGHDVELLRVQVDGLPGAAAAWKASGL